MNNEIVTQALSYLIKALFLILSGVLTFYVKTKIIPWLEDRQLYTTVKRYVQAAEKLASTGKLTTSGAKKDYVVSLLESKGIECGPEIHALIESAVEELDQLKESVISTFIGGATAETMSELKDGKGDDEDGLYE